MKTLRTLLSLTAALLVSGCSTAGTAADHADLEPLIGFAVQATTLRLNVISNGCTKSRDFELTIQRGSSDGFQSLAIRRVKPDVCRGMPREKEVLIDTAELAPAVPIVLRNAFIVPPRIARNP